MIRVNLLPVKRKKKAKALPAFIIYGVLLTLLAVVISGYLFWYFNSQVSALTQKKKENAAKIAELKNKIKEVENFEAQKKVLEQRKNLVEQLRKNQGLPVRILTEMSNVIPLGVWLQQMTVTGNDIKISGTGFTNEDVVNYVDNLKRSQFVTDIYLEGSQKKSEGKVITYQFTLKCNIKE